MLAACDLERRNRRGARPAHRRDPQKRQREAPRQPTMGANTIFTVRPVRWASALACMDTLSASALPARVCYPRCPTSTV